MPDHGAVEEAKVTVQLRDEGESATLDDVGVEEARISMTFCDDVCSRGLYFGLFLAGEFSSRR